MIEPRVPRFFPRRGTFALAVLLVAVLGVVYWQTRPTLAPGQEPLTDLPSIDLLREQFNDDSGEARLILLASPT